MQSQDTAHAEAICKSALIGSGTTDISIAAAVVTTVKIKKIHHGRYGLLAVASIPKIAGGSGSVIDFKFTIDKKFTYKGKKVSVLSAKCPDGKLQAHATAIFADGTKASTEFVRPCIGK